MAGIPPVWVGSRRERERERERERVKNVSCTLVGWCLVKTTQVAIGRSSPSKLYSGTVSSHTHSLIDEVECAVFKIICHLKTDLDKLFVRFSVGGHYSESVDCRTQSREHHMTTRTCAQYKDSWIHHSI